MTGHACGPKCICLRCHWFSCGYGESDPCNYWLRPESCGGPFKRAQVPSVPGVLNSRVTVEDWLVAAFVVAAFLMLMALR